MLEAGENYNGPDNGNDTLIGNAGSDVLYADPGATSSAAARATTCWSPRWRSARATPTTAAPARTRSPTAARTPTCGSQLGGTGAPPGCGTPDHVLADNEDLEGSDGPDVLIGDNGANSLFGHLGADTFIGKGGNDSIEAIDGQRDKKIDCGAGNDDVSRDRSDPQPIGC